VFSSKNKYKVLCKVINWHERCKTRCVGTTRMSPPWILWRLANVSTPYFVVLSSWCERWMYVLLIHIRWLTIIVCCLNFLFIIITRKREWVSDCCLAPNEQFSALSWREHAISTKYGVRNPGLGLWHWQKCAAVKPVNGIPTLSESFLVIGCFSSQYALNNYCTYDRFMLLRKQLQINFEIHLLFLAYYWGN
jgi:hypothetical protein